MNMNVQTGSQFWGRNLEKIRTKMIPYQLRALKDEVEGATPSHALSNFEITAGLKEGQYGGMVFQDSDLGKWIEAASYSLMLHKDAQLEREIDNIVDIIAKAQQPDGYLNTYFTIKDPAMRWQNLRECHEMYCAGHLIEGAVAYYQATGKDKFLNVMRRMADHIDEKFGPDGAPGYPGHPELELALYRLYDATRDERYARLADLFIDRRGQEPNYFTEEVKRLKGEEHFHGLRDLGLEYLQAHKPLREQRQAVGHAVRALYLYAGAADEAARTGDRALIEALDALWRNVTEKQMYVTGGVGATQHGEAFDGDLELPNDTVYAETCASVAFIFWARRMLKLHRRGEIADEMERALYNTVLAGANLAGDKFFYVNPLEVLPGISGVKTDYKHALPQRPAWFGCACCPPNMARLLLSLHKYAYGFQKGRLDIHLYVDGAAAFPGVRVTQTGEYPWDGALNYQIDCDEQLCVAIRIPGWSQNTALIADGEAVDVPARVRDGYVELALSKGQHTLRLTLDMRVRRVYANPAVRADTGCVALMRGPMVYCLESVEQPAPLCELCLPKDAEITVRREKEGVLADMCLLEADGLREIPSASLYSDAAPRREPCRLTAIPYFAWGNRGLNAMRVWIREG